MKFDGGLVRWFDGLWFDETVDYDATQSMDTMVGSILKYHTHVLV